MSQLSTRDRVAAYLPYLRRYARALTGDQHSGDNYVRATLEVLLAGQVKLHPDLSPRVALYRLFHDVWAGPVQSLSPAAEGALRGGASPEERLRGLSPVSRQALLLNALEGFTVAETGAVLDVSEDKAALLIAEAQAEIDRELATNVLVIEDEPVIAMDVQELAEELGHTVVAIARTRAEAVDLAHKHPPGLVLADIQLADDSSGMDAVRDILSEFDVPVVFVTAFPERLLTGGGGEPAYLITKPFERLTLKATIGQALFFHRRKAA
jgi:CheY-like chemotaxis protein/DNA-directed RNA polymerase specialized sigma24 family protein